MVRRHALRLAGPRVAAEPELMDPVLQLTADPSAKVRLQLVLTLGTLPNEAAAAALQQLAAEAADDPFMSAAFVSSMPRHLEALVDGISAGRTLPAPLLAALLELSEQRTDLTAQLLRAILPQDSTRADTETFRRPTEWLASLADRGRSPFQLSSSDDHDLELALTRLHDLMSHAWQIGLDPLGSEATRVAALQLVRFDVPARRREQRERLAELLTPQSPSTIQIETVRVLAQDHDDAATEPLLNAWSSFLPPTRALVVNLLLNDHTRGAQQLLARLEDGRISRHDLDVVSRDRLLHHPHEDLARAHPKAVRHRGG